jgi:hypothetical protein
MRKEEVSQRVLQNGKPLSLDKFNWDEETRTFSTKEDDLVIDFFCINNCTFKTESDCTFKTGYNCSFDTGCSCTFRTGSDCTFDTGSHCTFDTGFGCIFKTESDCTFNTCSNCTFKTGSECVVVRRDIFEVIELEKGKTITLCPYEVKGYIDEDGYLNGDEKLGKHIIEDGILINMDTQEEDKKMDEEIEWTKTLIEYYENEIKRNESNLSLLREDLTKLQFKKENRDV